MLRRRDLAFCCAVVVTLLATSLGSFCQTVHCLGNRKLAVEIRPVYPQLARKVKISGMVRLRVTVSTGGNPLRMDELGGSPLLLKAAMDAIAKAKWEPMAFETKEIVDVDFKLE
jgi:TonB family protein